MLEAVRHTDTPTVLVTMAVRCAAYAVDFMNFYAHDVFIKLKNTPQLVFLASSSQLEKRLPLLIASPSISAPRLAGPPVLFAQIKHDPYMLSTQKLVLHDAY